MQARRVGSLTFDVSPLKEDVERISGFAFDSRYEDYSLGGWKSCSLWNMNGDDRDGTSYEYEGAAKITRSGASLKYLPELISRHFRMDRCKSARVFAIKGGSLMQHRDYMEFDAGFTRLHLVLQTTPLSFNSEEDIVYQMRIGEIWFVDGRPVHSAANFSDEWRYHLIIDFDPSFQPEDLLRDVEGFDAPAVSVIERPPLPAPWTDLIHEAGDGMSGALLRQMIPMLARLHFFYAVNARDLFGWLTTMAGRTSDGALVEEVAAMRRKFIGEAAASH